MLTESSSLHDDAGRGLGGYVLTIVLYLSAFAATVGTSSRHSLTTSAVAWLAISVFACLQATSSGLAAATHAQTLAWVSGGLLALASMCERSLSWGDIWWAKVNCFHANIQDSD